ncbi:MAG TPA: hypothetical protein V6C84_18875 [Coleofasciculaceae cyanobacterium]|jgi:hypothetical protein
MKHKLLVNESGTLHLINCKLTKQTLIVGLACIEGQLPEKVDLLTDDKKEYVCTIKLSEAFQQVITSAAERDVNFDLES